MIEVINKYKSLGEPRHNIVYCGRGSVLGNPYSIDSLNNRNMVIAKYKKHFYEQIKSQNNLFIEQLKKIVELEKKHHTVKLECFCKPERCHCDIVKDYIDNNREGITNDNWI